VHLRRRRRRRQGRGGSRESWVAESQCGQFTPGSVASHSARLTPAMKGALHVALGDSGEPQLAFCVEFPPLYGDKATQMRLRRNSRVVAAYFLVERAKGSAWDHSRLRREQDGWAEHAAFMDALSEQGSWSSPARSRGRWRQRPARRRRPRRGAIRARLAEDPGARRCLPPSRSGPGRC